MCLAGYTVTILDEMRAKAHTSPPGHCWLHVDSMTICPSLWLVIFIHFPSCILSVSLSINCIPGSHPKVHSSRNRISGDFLPNSHSVFLSISFSLLPLSDTHSVNCLKNPTHLSCSQNRKTVGRTSEIQYDSCDMSR